MSAFYFMIIIQMEILTIILGNRGKNLSQKLL